LKGITLICKRIEFMIKRKSVSLLFCHTSYESTAAFHSLGPNHHPIFKILIHIGDWIGPLPHSKGKVRTTQVDLIGKHLLFYISWSSSQNNSILEPKVMGVSLFLLPEYGNRLCRRNVA
jgi:hypothetical protein